MPKYTKGRPYDIIRDIKQMQEDIKQIKLALGQLGVSLGPSTTGGTSKQPVAGGSNP